VVAELLHGSRISQRGLNSLELLSYLKTTYHITGDEKYQKLYLQMAVDNHYALNTIYQREPDPRYANHSDDELAALVYANLLRYEKDPALRAIYWPASSAGGGWSGQSARRLQLHLWRGDGQGM